MAAGSGIDTIVGDAVGGSAAAWGVRADVAVGSHGRGGSVSLVEEPVYMAAHAVFVHYGEELQAVHGGWPADECSSRRLEVAVMAFVRPAVDFLKTTRPAWTPESNSAVFRSPIVSRPIRREM